MITGLLYRMRYLSLRESVLSKGRSLYPIRRVSREMLYPTEMTEMDGF